MRRKTRSHQGREAGSFSTNSADPPTRLPFVLINMAMTADGKIATANRAVSSFGSRRDHEHLLTLRATADAVMCGARTADLNKINLGPGSAKFRKLRLRRGLSEFNLRILVSGGSSINPRAEIFRHRFSPIIVLTTKQSPAVSRRRLLASGAELQICGASEIDFGSALGWLHERWGVRRLLCEGGGELNDALFRAGLVNELHLTVCPKLFGGRNAPTIADGRGFPSLPEAAQLALKSARQRGNELFLVYSVTTPSFLRPKLR